MGPEYADLMDLPLMGDDFNGAFVCPSCLNDKDVLRILSGRGGGWDHVSVSLKHRIPQWLEMEQVKRIFFLPDEWAFQLHAPPSKHINCHLNVLHIWRPIDQDIPIPPEVMV